MLLISQFSAAGYDIHITQKEYWADENKICINKEALSKYLKTDLSIQVDNNNSASSYLVNINKNQYPMWIDSAGCDLVAKDPNTDFLNKLIEIAKALGAKVQGDEGEIYITPDEFIFQ